MSRNTRDIPFKEIEERVIDITRIPENSVHKVRGAIQDVYCYELPSKFDWDFLFASSGITTIAEIRDGTISVNTGDTTVQFSSDANFAQTANGKRIKIGDAVYSIAYVNSTTGTLNTAYWGNTNLSGAQYSLFQDRYPLSKDFDRFPKNGGMYRWDGGRKTIIEEQAYQTEAGDFSSNPSTPKYLRIIERDTAGCYQIQFQPPPKTNQVYGYDYLRHPRPLDFSSAGTVTISGNGTTVTGSNTRFTEMTTGDYLRVDSLGTKEDSYWYPILSVANNFSLTLGIAFANTSVTSANYVISRAPEMPARLHVGVIWGAVRNMMIDQNDPNTMIAERQFSEAMSDGKRLFVTRIYNKDIRTIASEEYTYRR